MNPVRYLARLSWRCIWAVVLFSQFCGVWAHAQPPPDNASPGSTTPAKPKFFEFSGLVFGDVYGVPSHHLEEADGRSAAWIRRVYVTGNFNLTRNLFVRVRGEINQDGDFVSNQFTMDFKDLFIRWTVRGHKLLFGLTPSPTFDLQDGIWAYRYLERTPLDVQGVPSRDFGFSALGPLNSSGSIRYRVMLGTGNEFGRETGEGQKLMGAVSFGHDDRGLLVDVYGDFQKLPGPTDITTGSLFLHYRFQKIRLGGLYTYQDREEDPRLVVGSGFVVADVASKIALIGRVDRLFAPSPRGNDIDYLPFDPSSKATLFIGGIEFRPWEHMSLTPNVQSVIYDRNPEGNKPRSDLFLRFTFYLHYP